MKHKTAKIPVLLIACMILSGSSMCQSLADKQAQINVSLGATHARLIDEGFTNNRLKFTGTHFFMAVSYWKVRNKHLFGFRFQGSSGNTFTGDHQLPSKLHYAKLAVAYARRTAGYSLSGLQNKLYLGGEFSSVNYLLEDVLDWIWYTGNATTTFNQAFHFFCRHSTQLNERSALEINFSFPLAGWIKRTKYEDGINQRIEKDFQSKNLARFIFNDSKFSLIRPLSLPEFSIGYTRQLGQTLNFTSTYSFRLVSNTSIDPISLYANGLLFGLKLYLNK